MDVNALKLTLHFKLMFDSQCDKKSVTVPVLLNLTACVSVWTAVMLTVCPFPVHVNVCLFEHV